MKAQNWKQFAQLIRSKSLDPKLLTSKPKHKKYDESIFGPIPPGWNLIPENENPWHEDEPEIDPAFFSPDLWPKGVPTDSRDPKYKKPPGWPMDFDEPEQPYLPKDPNGKVLNWPKDTPHEPDIKGFKWPKGYPRDPYNKKFPFFPENFKEPQYWPINWPTNPKNKKFKWPPGWPAEIDDPYKPMFPHGPTWKTLKWPKGWPKDPKAPHFRWPPGWPRDPKKPKLPYILEEG